MIDGLAFVQILKDGVVQTFNKWNSCGLTFLLEDNH